MSFVKIHQSILRSSLWSESHTTRIVWITMLALADQDGVVESSISGLARAAVVTIEEARAALETFMSPDPDSRDGTTGERISAVPGGWLVLNHSQYRDKRTATQIATAERVRKHRARHPEAARSRLEGDPTETRRGEIYVIQRGEDGPLKVGFSYSTMVRVAEMQTAVPERLRVLTIVAGHQRQEGRIHRDLKEMGLNIAPSREWYRNDPRVIAAVTGIAAVTPGNAFPPSEAEAEAEADTEAETEERTPPSPPAPVPSPKPPTRKREASARATELAALWAKECPHLPQPASPMADGVIDACEAALKRDPDMDRWHARFVRVRDSAFLSGRKKDWRASLTWVLGKKNCAKIDGGDYDDHEAPPQARAVAPPPSRAVAAINALEQQMPGFFDLDDGPPEPMVQSRRLLA